MLSYNSFYDLYLMKYVVYYIFHKMFILILKSDRNLAEITPIVTAAMVSLYFLMLLAFVYFVFRKKLSKCIFF